MRIGWCLLFLTLAADVQAREPLVEISVEVVEVDTTKSRELGFKWIDTFPLLEAAAPGVFSLGAFERGRMYGTLKMLMDEGAADLLANPKLVTESSTTAHFHAGGELPYIAKNTLGSAEVIFKPYGVRLDITPDVDEADRRIRLKLRAEVSQVDEQTSAVTEGTRVPGILTRWVENQIAMEEGGTLTVAGLLQTVKTTRRRGVPFLGRIPVLGLFFSREERVWRKTSVVMFLTPRVVKPEGQGT